MRLPCPRLRASTQPEPSDALTQRDETHTVSAGPGGCTQAWELDPDFVTIGKAIGGGVPCGALGLSAEVEARLLAAQDADLVDTGGIGGTLANLPPASVYRLRRQFHAVPASPMRESLCQS